MPVPDLEEGAPSPSASHYLHAISGSDEAVSALSQMWANEAVMDLLLGDEAATLRREGHCPAHVLDAMRHNLTGDQAGFAYNNGFSAHQAHLIEHTPHAVANLWDQDEFDVAEFVESDAPRQFLVDVLLASDSHGLATHYRKTWEEDPDGRDDLESGVRLLVLTRNDAAAIADCCPLQHPLDAPQSTPEDTCSVKPLSATRTSPADDVSPRQALIDALHLSWDDDNLEHVLHPAAADMRAHGHSPEAAIDAMYHHLDAETAGFYMSAGFSAHQAHLIDTNPHATDNVFGHGLADIGDLFAREIPRDHVTNVLLTADGIDDVERLLTAYETATPTDRAALAASTAQTAASQPRQPLPGCCG